MPRLSDNQFFLGHHKSWDDPCGDMIEEYQHPKGAWVGIFESKRRYSYGNYFVVQRNNRKQSIVTVVHPEKCYFYSRKAEIDIDFIDQWGYTWGFEDDLEAARSYLKHLLATGDHPRIYKPYKRRRPKDAQRQKVYEWEMNFYKKGMTKQMERDQVEQFVRQIERDFFGIARRAVNLSFYERGGCFQRGLSDVNLARYGWNRDVVVHEMAHWVDSNLNGKLDHAGHGPTFVGIFMLMMEHYQGCCMADMINKALEMNLKFIFPQGGLRAIMAQPQMEEAA